jgi:hypothetical protein
MNRNHNWQMKLVQAGRNNPPVKIFPLLSALVENVCRTGLVGGRLNFSQLSAADFAELSILVMEG